MISRAAKVLVVMFSMQRKQATLQQNICLRWIMEAELLASGSASPCQHAGPQDVHQSAPPAAQPNHQTAGSPQTRSSLLWFEAVPPREQLSVVNRGDCKLSFKKERGGGLA